MKQPTIAVLPLGGKLYQRYMEHMYLSSLRRSGAQVVVLPPVVSQGELEWIARAYDGFLFTGGADVEPALYGEERILQCGPIDSVQGRYGTPTLSVGTSGREAYLAICRGFQVMNVVFGGTFSRISLPSGPVPWITHKWRNFTASPTVSGWSPAPGCTGQCGQMRCGSTPCITRGLTALAEG